jgi:hypothetical protein
MSADLERLDRRLRRVLGPYFAAWDEERRVWEIWERRPETFAGFAEAERHFKEPLPWPEPAPVEDQAK